jgi:hypothetical protein
MITENIETIIREGELNLSGNNQSSIFIEVSRVVEVNYQDLQQEKRDRTRRGLRRIILSGINDEKLDELLEGWNKMKNPSLKVSLNKKERPIGYEFTDLDITK